MPDKKEDIKEVNQKVDDKKEVKKEQPKETAPRNNTWAWLFGIILVLIFFGLVTSSLGFAAWARHNRDGVYMHGPVGIERGFGRHGMRGMTGDGYYGPENNQIVVSGVVTAVNGAGFTIAGNGTTNNIQTNSSTKYSNGSKVNVNDSVTVAGTTNNGTFTASQVVIRNNNL